MSLKFTKMHGLGNDFMVVDGINQQVMLNKTHIARLANRHTGIGFDQLLLVEPPKSPEADFFYRIFNADGHEVGQCGNGARCLARFVRHYGLTTKKQITVATATTKMQLHINADETVTVDFGIPQFEPARIPMKAEKRCDSYTLPVATDQSVTVHALCVGNPHAVMVVDAIETAPVDTLGQTISTHACFPLQTNAGFMQIIDKNHIRLRVHERGCGETRACGSGAVAAAAAARLYHGLDARINVALPGGNLVIDWPDITQSITLTGTATFVYEGALLCEL